MKKPASEKIVHAPVETFTVREPVELIITKEKGKKKSHWRFAEYHFTTAEVPVTIAGKQYIPLSTFDKVRWDKICNK